MERKMGNIRGLGSHVRLLPSEAMDRMNRDYRYLMELKEENLLFSFYTEAGLNGRLNYRLGPEVHGGWDSPLSQIRGTFTGHWLSAAAHMIRQTGDRKLKAKAEDIVEEIGRCQEANGGEWAFGIPEKYLFGLRRGQHFWAPQYVCHKVMMGLLDMYRVAGNETALKILEGCADWFLRFTDSISRREMDQMMDDEETGGIMELWADLYGVTGRPEHLELMRRYERPALTEGLLEGRDVLTNMHANATIPEIHGCARAYEVTGEARYRRIVEAYWEQAVEQRGSFATGGQTDGEIWTPPHRQSARLGEMNQEHCVVYNMIRLADYLYRWSGDVKYLDYMEQNIYNGLFAQGFWEGRALDGALENHVPDSGIVCYYLPLESGSTKKWGRKTEDFWCCHGTVVQANAKYGEWLWYRRETDEEGRKNVRITAAQYIPSVLRTQAGGRQVEITLEDGDLAGNYLKIYPVAARYHERPSFWQKRLHIRAEQAEFELAFRLPWWLTGEAEVFIGGEKAVYRKEGGFGLIKRVWSEETVELVFPKAVLPYPLPDRPDTVAFLDGPVVLAGLTDGDVLYSRRPPKEETEKAARKEADPGCLPKGAGREADAAWAAGLFCPHHEREWEHWKEDYRTVGQPHNFKMIPLKNVGRETYTVYFEIQEKQG